MTDSSRKPGRNGIPEGFDPITFEVLNNAFSAVIDEMGIVLEKVAFSTVTSEGHDYSCAIANARGEVVSRGVGDLPLIGGTITFRIGAVLKAFPPETLQDGDILLFNDPYEGGTHLQDVSAILPVFHEGKLFALVQTCSHWPDVGGPVPGSFNSEATSSHGEGLLIPPIHIVRAGVWQEQVERLILRNVRIPQVIAGDLRGLIEAARSGGKQLRKLLDDYGPETLSRAMDGFLDHTEALLRDEIEALPDGTYSWTDHIDRDPGTPGSAPIPIGLDVTIKGSSALFDFSRSGPQARGPVNCARSATVSASLAVAKAIFPKVPLNDGYLRVIDFKLPDDCVLNAKYPAPVSGHAANSAEKVVSCVHGCFLQAAPDRAMAAPTNLVNISVFGFDSRPGRESEYVMYLWLCGGWGGRPKAGDNHTFMMPLAAGTRLQFAETLERVYPVLVDGYGLTPDTEGAGKFRGGFGLSWPFRITHGDATINTQGDREIIQNWGFDGGQPASGNKLIYAPGTPQEEGVSLMRAGYPIRQGVPLDYHQGGGGGVGNPLERNPEAVMADVRAELMSIARARAVYGVAIRVVDADLAEYAIDMDETARLRSAPGVTE